MIKRINDTYGHECGDRMLCMASRTLTVNVQKRDSVSRWGGEEFFEMVPGEAGG